MDHIWCLLLLVSSAVLAFAFPGMAQERLQDWDRESANTLVAPMSCHVKEFNFTATVTDHNGKKCSGRVMTKACFGSCESSETGTFRFPWVLRVQPVCNYGQVITRIVRLRHCEQGADRDAAFYRFPEAKSCVCEKCDKKRQHCEPATTKAPSDPDFSVPPDVPKKQSTSDSFDGYSNDSPYQSDSALLDQLFPRRKRR